MSKNSTVQRKDQLDGWYKWFNAKYNRYNTIRSQKPTKDY